MEIEGLTKLGIPALVVLLAIKIIWEVVTFFLKKDQELKDKTARDLTEAMIRNTRAINKAFTAIKILAGDKWKEIREEIRDDGISN